MKYKDLFDEEDLMSDFNDKDYSKYDIKADSDFRWQKKCLESISNEDSVILSSPTGSGKTRVFLEWADLKKDIFQDNQPIVEFHKNEEPIMNFGNEISIDSIVDVPEQYFND